MKLRIVFIPLLAILLTVTGCQHAGGIRITNYPDQTVEILNKKLARYVETGPVRSERTNDFLTVQVGLQNTARTKNFDLEYRFQWLNEGGVEVAGPAPTWTRLRLTARDHALAQGTAPSRNISNYIFLVREQ